MANTIIKGDEMQLFINNKTIGYCTAHSFSRSSETIEVASKDHGFYPTKEISKITWQVTAEAYYTDVDYDSLVTSMDAGQPIEVIFAHVNNYDTKGLKDIGEGTVTAWEQGAGYKGKAIISQLDGTFNNGEKATFSLTLDGVGSLTKITATT